MTPSENAHEIFYRIYAWLDDKDKDTALELAILFSKMMLENAGMIWEGINTETGLTARDEFRKYWQETKEELRKL
jgi:hypothetical protein